MDATVRVMRSHDYCHFEIQLSGPCDNDHDVDELRKRAQRLADKAVSQYQIARRVEDARANAVQSYEHRRLREEVALMGNTPDAQLTPEQLAKRRSLSGWEFHASRSYDYEDDFEVDKR